jgi:hypothetical protein
MHANAPNNAIIPNTTLTISHGDIPAPSLTEGSVLFGCIAGVLVLVPVAVVVGLVYVLGSSHEGNDDGSDDGVGCVGCEGEGCRVDSGGSVASVGCVVPSGSGGAGGTVIVAGTPAVTDVHNRGFEVVLVVGVVMAVVGVTGLPLANGS